MTQTSTRVGFALSLALLCLGLFSLVPRTSFAQDSPTKVVVLNVPGGGTEHLHQAISNIDDVELEDQAWFLEQIQSRGFQAKGIMKRPDDIKWLMQGAKADYIFYMAAQSDTLYQARVVGPETGEPVHSFEVDRTPDGLSTAGARTIEQEFGGYLADQRAAKHRAERAESAKPQVAQLDAPDAPKDSNEIKRQAAESDAAAKAKFSKDWLIASVRAHGLRRDFHVAGVTEQTLLAYTSAFYPGFSLDIEAFPLGQNNPEYAGIGVYANYTQGFDSITLVSGDGEESPVSVGHMKLEGGLLYQLGDALELDGSRDTKFHLALGLRHSNYGVAQNPSLPSISHTAVVLGTRVTQPAFSDKFKIRAGASISPIGFYGTGAELFGESSHTYGFGADLGAMYLATEDIGITAGYEFGLQRTVFTGTGEAQFEDADAFELVQGLTGGLFYQY